MEFTKLPSLKAKNGLGSCENDMGYLGIFVVWRKGDSFYYKSFTRVLIALNHVQFRSWHRQYCSEIYVDYNYLWELPVYPSIMTIAL